MILFQKYQFEFWINNGKLIDESKLLDIILIWLIIKKGDMWSNLDKNQKIKRDITNYIS